MFAPEELPPEAPVELVPRVIEVPVPLDFQEQERALIGDDEPLPAHADVVPAAHPHAQAEQPMPHDMGDDTDVTEAREADRKARLTAGMALAGRQLVGAITRTPVAEGLGPAPAQLPDAQARARDRRRALVDALQRARQGRLDESTIALQRSEAAKNSRQPQEKGIQIDYTEAKKSDAAIRREALSETIRHNRAIETKAGTPKGNASGGLHTTSPSTLTDLADAETAINELEPLGKKFTTLKQSGSYAKLKAGMTNALGLQGTDAAEYQAAALRSMQGVGKILEGGKLAAGDELKYRKLLPQAGDSEEIAKQKIQESQAFLRHLKDERIKVLRDAHYDVPDVGARQPAPKTGGGKASPGAGYVRAKVKGVSGWYNAASHDFEAD